MLCGRHTYRWVCGWTSSTRWTDKAATGRSRYRARLTSCIDIMDRVSSANVDAPSSTHITSPTWPCCPSTARWPPRATPTAPGSAHLWHGNWPFCALTLVVQLQQYARCVCVFGQNLTIKLNDLLPRYLARWFTLALSTSCSKVKVIRGNCC